MTASTEKTLRHKLRVSALLGIFAKHLITRAAVHDDSKFTEEESAPLEVMDELIRREGNAPFGSEEYKRRSRDILGPMLAHHYANNSHHPEHYAQGIDGMNLFDLVEMFLDWKAASERGEESSMNLEAARDRFKVNPQLHSIFVNTAKFLDWNP